MRKLPAEQLHRPAAALVAKWKKSVEADKPPAAAAGSGEAGGAAADSAAAGKRPRYSTFISSPFEACTSLARQLSFCCGSPLVSHASHTSPWGFIMRQLVVSLCTATNMPSTCCVQRGRRSGAGRQAPSARRWSSCTGAVSSACQQKACMHSLLHELSGRCYEAGTVQHAVVRAQFAFPAFVLIMSESADVVAAGRRRQAGVGIRRP